MAEKKYFWLKLKDDFFEDKYIKALRKLPGGDEMVIVYLKLQLKNLKTEGLFKYEHIMPSVADELALILDEDVSIIQATLISLERLKLIEIWDNESIYMKALQELIGSESSVASRVRRHRERQKALQCNTCNENCNTEKEIEKEKEIEIEIEIEIEKDIEKKRYIVEIVNYLNSVCDTHFKSTSKTTQQHIKARLEEGYTVDDFKQVIEKKHFEWKDNANLVGYLRPQTLFGTKFESYLNQNIKGFKQKDENYVELDF